MGFDTADPGTRHEACSSCGSFPHAPGCEERRRFKESEVRAAGRIMAGPPGLYEAACALLAPDGRRALAEAMARAREEHVRTGDGDGWRCSCDGYARLRPVASEPPSEHDAEAVASLLGLIAGF